MVVVNTNFTAALLVNQERLSKPTIAAICFAALSLFPLILAQAHIFIWLAAATLGTGWALLVSLVSTPSPQRALAFVGFLVSLCVRFITQDKSSVSLIGS